MSYELLNILSIVAFVLAGIFFLLAIALFFLLNIPKLFGEITGRTAKKSIESINRQNASGSEVAHSGNTSQRKKTDKITHSGRVIPGDAAPSKPQTAQLGQSQPSQPPQPPQGYPPPSGETVVLSGDVPGAGETVVLSNGFAPIGETVVLSADSNPHTAYAAAEAVIPDAPPKLSTEFSIAVDMSFTSSSEIIE